MEHLFKALVTFSYLAYVVLFALSYNALQFYSQGTIEALSWTGFGSLIEFYESLVYAFLVAYTVVLYGLLSFKAWARPLFVILTVLSLLLIALQGIAVYPAIDGVIMYLTSLADGAAIALMYLTSVGTKFNETT